MRVKSKENLYKVTFLVVTLLYISFVVLLPASPEVLQRYQLTQGGVRLLRSTIAVPSVLIWLVALYGFFQFKQYADTIKGSKEWKGFHKLSNGLMVLVFSLPLLAALTSFFTYLGFRNPELLPELTIVKNYTALVFHFIAFILLAMGADELIHTIKVKSSGFNIPHFGLAGCLALASIYTWLITTRPLSSTGNSYHLPNALIITTLALPYLFIWSRGAIAVYQLYVYKTRVKGTIYREALNALAFGIATIIILSIFLQILATLTARLLGFNLSPLLFIVYLLLILSGIGYGFIARGSKKLKQIEEV